MHSRLGCTTLLQPAFPTESNVNFPWEKSLWDNTIQYNTESAVKASFVLVSCFKQQPISVLQFVSHVVAGGGTSARKLCGSKWWLLLTTCNLRVSCVLQHLLMLGTERAVVHCWKEGLMVMWKPVSLCDWCMWKLVSVSVG